MAVMDSVTASMWSFEFILGAESVRKGAGGGREELNEPQQSTFRRENLRCAYPCLGMKDLTLEIRQVYAIGVENA